VRLPDPVAIRTYACAVLGLIVVTLLVVPVFAQHSGGNGIPQDWTHHYLVFSDPGTEEDALRNGTYDDWARIVNDRRYVAQQLRRRASVQGPAADIVARINAAARDEEAAWVGIAPEGGPIHGLSRSPLLPKPAPRVLQKDWSASILTGAVLPNMFPAKYTFNPIGAPNCATDYVVFPTGSTGSGTAATVVAYNNLYATTCSGTVPSVYWAYNTGAAAVTTSPVLSGDGTQVAFIQVTSGGVASLVLVKWNAGPVGRGVTGSVTSGSTAFTISAGTLTQADVGAQITGTGIPANDTIASVGSSTSGTLATAATATEANEALTIVAEAAATPAVAPTAASAAAYHTCTAPCMFTLTLSGSPNDSFSSPFYDYGDDALYVGDNSSHLHKFTGVFSGTPTEATSVTLNATAYDVASPVYDATSGCVFVGDNQGDLYKVNSGVAGSQCVSGTFSLNVTSEVLGNATAGQGIFDAPLVDSTAGTVYVFVAGSVGISRGVTGSVTSGSTAFSLTAGTLTQADVGRVIAGTGIPAADKIATVTGGTTGTLTTAATATHAGEALTITSVTATDNAIDQFATSFGAGAAPNSAQDLGTGGANFNLLAGAFDNVYYSSGSTTPSGNIYVVGNTAAAGGGALFRVPIVSNVMEGAVSAVTVNSTHQVWATPITEFCNNGASACVVTTGGTCGAGVTCTTSGTDYLFFSANRVSVGGSCTNATGDGCVLAYNVNTTTPSLSSSLNLLFPDSAGDNGCWGTSAFIIDNASTATGASQVYFVNFGQNFPSAGTANCQDANAHTGNTMDATQAAQSAL